MIGQANLPTNNVTGGKEGLPRTKKRRHKIKQKAQSKLEMLHQKGERKKKQRKEKEENFVLTILSLLRSIAVKALQISKPLIKNG